MKLLRITLMVLILCITIVGGIMVGLHFHWNNTIPGVKYVSEYCVIENNKKNTPCLYYAEYLDYNKDYHKVYLDKYNIGVLYRYFNQISK